MTQILPIISTKGGEGKSTQAANIAGFLADSGLKTLLIDGDYAQPTASSIYRLIYEAPCGLTELLMQTVDLTNPGNIISQTLIPGLDIIISNDPQGQLKTAMLHAPDGRLRLRNVLQHPLFQSYDAIIIDSQGARSVMLELILLAATDTAVGVVKPILPDVREFLRGTVGMMEQLLPLCSFGLHLPEIRILINCMTYTRLAGETLAELKTIIEQGQYSQHADKLQLSLLTPVIYELEIYKSGHAAGLPVHRLEKTTIRKSDSALSTMHQLCQDLFPEWQCYFNDFIVKSSGVLSHE